MAEQAATTAIREAVAERLREIATAGGYRTNAGGDVRTEPSQFEASDGPRITVYSAGKSRPDDAKSPGERYFTIVVEALAPTALATAQAEIEAMEADIEQALDMFSPGLQSVQLLFQESLFLDRPDGIAAMAAQLSFATRYRR